MAIALTDLLPQNPMVGPPLPKGLNIMWPWSKAAAFDVGDRVAVGLPGGLILGTGTIQSAVSPGQYHIQLDSGISETIPASFLSLVAKAPTPEAKAPTPEATPAEVTKAAQEAAARAKAAAEAAQAAQEAAARAKTAVEAAQAVAAQATTTVGAAAIAPPTPKYATITSITGSPTVKRGTSFPVGGVLTNLDTKPHNGRLTVYFGQPGNPKIVNLVIIPERLLTIQPGTTQFTGSVTVPKKWEPGLYPFTGLLLDTSVSPFHSSKLQGSVIIT